MIVVCFFNAFFLSFIGLVLCTFLYNSLSSNVLIIIHFILFGFLLFSLFSDFSNLLFLDKFDAISFSPLQKPWYNCSLDFSLQVDFIGFTFIVLILLISQVALVLSPIYLKNEFFLKKFLLLIVWFTLGMILLVISDSILSLLLGWEAIGVTSFLLINFWFQRKISLNSAFKAFIHNKFSDIFLLFSCVFVVFVGGSSVLTVLLENQEISLNIASKTKISTFFLLIASNIKSAQILTHLWLIDSMEAPTPASALIHSATLVSAGIFLLLKFQVFIFYCNFSSIIFYFGSLTAFICGVSASVQTDMKKTLAYSTISHCGFLFVCISLNNITLILTYLCLHGIFKASTFFCISHIMRVTTTQDIRYSGNFFSKSSVSTLLLSISLINLGGLPYTCGYLFKEIFFFEIIRLSGIKITFLFLALVTSILYTYRLVYFICFDFGKGIFPALPSFSQLSLNARKYYYFKNYVGAYLGAICYLFFFGFLTSYIIEYFFFYSSLALQLNFFIFLENYHLLQFFNVFFISYYHFYIGLSIVIFFTLFLITYRNIIFKNQFLFLLLFSSISCINSFCWFLSRKIIKRFNFNFYSLQVNGYFPVKFIFNSSLFTMYFIFIFLFGFYNSNLKSSLNWLTYLSIFYINNIESIFNLLLFFFFSFKIMSALILNILCYPLYFYNLLNCYCFEPLKFSLVVQNILQNILEFFFLPLVELDSISKIFLTSVNIAVNEGLKRSVECDAWLLRFHAQNKIYQDIKREFMLFFSASATKYLYLVKSPVTIYDESSQSYLLLRQIALLELLEQVIAAVNFRNTILFPFLADLPFFANSAKFESDRFHEVQWNISHIQSIYKDALHNATIKIRPLHNICESGLDPTNIIFFYNAFSYLTLNSQLFLTFFYIFLENLLEHLTNFYPVFFEAVQIYLGKEICTLSTIYIQAVPFSPKCISIDMLSQSLNHFYGIAAEAVLIHLGREFCILSTSDIQAVTFFPKCISIDMLSQSLNHFYGIAAEAVLIHLGREFCILSTSDIQAVTFSLKCISIDMLSQSLNHFYETAAEAVLIHLGSLLNNNVEASTFKVDKLALHTDLLPRPSDCSRVNHDGGGYYLPFQRFLSRFLINPTYVNMDVLKAFELYLYSYPKHSVKTGVEFSSVFDINYNFSVFDESLKDNALRALISESGLVLGGETKLPKISKLYDIYVLLCERYKITYDVIDLSSSGL